MSNPTSPFLTGGCLCGQLRYRAEGSPKYAGYCCCADCRRASGSGFVPFMGFAAVALEVTGETTTFSSTAFTGGEAVRNSCPRCGGLVFGGRYGVDQEHTLYAGSLDDPGQFRPTVAIFNRDRPEWVSLPDGLKVFDTMPD